ncbi:MFS transporter [Micromonospora sp. NPDC049559]|uniref:MFS transporter n=1 Tax=Micromonospora sp. NPDC049559 TaxID=3155923 RepID=UPI0034260CC3
MTQARDVTPTRPRTGVMSHSGGFWLLGAALLILMSAAGAPTPLYVVYQQRWGFSATVLTSVFAIYALALLVALVTVGALSDHLGRRPVLAAALVAEAASMLVFLDAHGVGWLLAARTVQGLATGAAAGAISAALVDLQPPARPRRGALVNSIAPAVGLAVGALGSGLLLQYASAPTTLVFGGLAVAFVLLALAVALLPETVSRRPGALASLRPRIAVPAHARPHFLSATPPLVATWAIGGLYLSLGPSLTASSLHVGSHLVGGLVVTTLMGFGAAAALFARDRAPRRVMVVGSVLLAAGTAVSLLALGLGSAPLFFAGTAVAGVGFGAAFLGAFRSLAALPAPGERAELFASIYVVSYLAFSVPAVAAGMIVPRLGLGETATGYGLVVIVLGLLAALPRFARVGQRVAPGGAAD